MHSAKVAHPAGDQHCFRHRHNSRGKREASSDTDCDPGCPVRRSRSQPAISARTLAERLKPGSSPQRSWRSTAEPFSSKHEVGNLPGRVVSVQTTKSSRESYVTAAGASFAASPSCERSPQSIIPQTPPRTPRIFQLSPVTGGGPVTPGSVPSSPRKGGASAVTVFEPPLLAAAAAAAMGSARVSSIRSTIGSSATVPSNLNVLHPPALRPATMRQTQQSRTLEDACTLGYLHMQTLRRVENQLRSELRTCRDDLMEVVTAETEKACEALGTRLENSCKAALRAEAAAREANATRFDSRLAGLASVVDTLSASMQKAAQSEQKLLQRLDDMMQESAQGKLLQYLDGLREAELLERRELQQTFSRRLDELAGKVQDSLQSEARARTRRVDEPLAAAAAAAATWECAWQHEMPLPIQEQWCRSSTSALEEPPRSKDSSTLVFDKASESQRVAQGPHSGMLSNQQPQQHQQQHPTAANCSTSLLRLGSRAEMDVLQAPQIISPRREHRQPTGCSVSYGVPRLHDYSPRSSLPWSARWTSMATMAVATS